MGAIAPVVVALMLDVTLLGKTRAAILRELFLNPDRKLSFNELVRRTKSGAGAVSRELQTLTEAGLVTEQREGNQRFLTAETRSPVYAELKSFIAKCSGAASVIREALRGVEDEIAVAFIFGSVAAGTEQAESDLDLFVIGLAGYSVVTERLRAAENRLGRRVQVLYFDAESAHDRASLRKSSMKKIMQGPKMFVLGSETQLAELKK
jgi:DNA-binding transcriptional ArsR family regulator